MRDIIRKIAEKAGCYASFDALTNRIKIFWDIKAIKAVELEIDNCFSELKFKKDFELNGLLPNDVLADQTIKKIIYDPKVVFYFKYREKRLTIETSNEPLLKVIPTAIDVYRSGNIDLSQSSLIGFCMLCFEQAEVPYTLLCQHTYCVKCLEDYIDDSLKDLSNFLITLPCDDCKGQFIIIADISNLTSRKKFIRLLELAALEYLKNNKPSLSRCLTPGCDQMFNKKNASQSNVFWRCLSE